MRVAVDEVRQQTHLQHHRFHPIANFLARHLRMIGAQRLGNDFANGHTRVQGRQRILENHLDITAHIAPFIRLHPQQIFAKPGHFPVGGFHQADDRTRKRRLAAAGFAHHAQSLPFVQA